MAVKHKSWIELRTTIDLDESEIRALEALAGYGIDGFLETFYTKMGKHYLQPHEKGLRSLFKNINETTKPAISHVDKARKILKDNGVSR